jgi:hypothetical protein
MIKMVDKFDYTTASRVQTGGVSFISRYKSYSRQGYQLDSPYFQYPRVWSAQQTIGPTILTTWSK